MPTKKTKSSKTSKNKTIPKPKKLYRSKTDQLVGGVAAGIAEYLDLDPTVVRLIFVLMTIFNGAGLIIYIVLWLIMPSGYKVKGNYIDQNTQEIGEKISQATEKFSQSNHTSKIGGIVLIALGILFLTSSWGILSWLDFSKLWPLIPIFIGISILLKK